MTVTTKNISIPHSAPLLGGLEEKAVLRCLRSRFVGNGDLAKRLEKQVCERTGRKYGFAVSSGFHALLLGLRAFDLRQTSKICLPVLTCASVLAAVQNAGHRAVLADVEERTLTLDVRAIPKDCAAVIAPHAYGAPVQASAIERLGLPWIEDCATSPATRVEGRPAGGWGTFAVFSFASTKYLTGGSGGVLICDDDMLAARVEDLLNFDSFDKRGCWKNGWHGALPGKMADINASLANVQLNRMEEFWRRRREIAETYNSILHGLEGLKVTELTHDHSFYRYIVRTDEPSEGICQKLHNLGIDARTSVNPWLDNALSSTSNAGNGPWPFADKWRGHLLSLPIHPSMSDEEAKLIAQSLRKAMDGSST
jgi:perosamine synthetase